MKIQRAVCAIVLMVLLASYETPVLAQAHADHSPTKLEQSIFALSSVSLWGATAADAITTDRLIETGRFREGNPILARENGTLNKPALFVLTAGQNAATYYLYRHGHPRWAAAVNFLVAGAHLAIAFTSNRRLP